MRCTASCWQPAVRPDPARHGRCHGALRRPARHRLGHLPRAGRHRRAAGEITIDKVAGPVGEALIMTAVGLAVAIPAVLAYNVFGRARAHRGRAGRLRARPARDDRQETEPPAPAVAAPGRGRVLAAARRPPARPERGFELGLRSLERNPGAQPMSDINITPLVDVMLVLLVIFMITAPLMTSILKLDLPKRDAGQPSDTPQFVACRPRPRGPLLLRRGGGRHGGVRGPRRRRRQEESADRGAAARRQGGAVRARRRAHRHRPEGRPDADRLHRRPREVARHGAGQRQTGPTGPRGSRRPFL